MMQYASSIVMRLVVVMRPQNKKDKKDKWGKKKGGVYSLSPLTTGITRILIVFAYGEIKSII